MRKLITTLCVAAALAVTGCAAAGYTVFPDSAAFSYDILFTAKLYGGNVSAAHERMLGLIADIDGQVSLTKPTSDLSRFNAAAAGERVEVGEHCYNIFTAAAEYYELTDGAFNPAALPLSELWHVDARSIAQYAPEPGIAPPASPSLPTPDEVAATLEYCTPANVTAEKTADGKFYMTKRDGRTRLDFGGIAKGYAVDMCVSALGGYGVTSALLDISGNAYFYGTFVSGGGSGDWHVGVTAPRPRAGETLGVRGYVCAISLAGGVSAVTSGDYMRYYVHSDGGGSVYVPHIIGADGVPIGVEYADGRWRNTDVVISATVIGGSSALCDALSTAVCALGTEAGGKLLQKVGCKGLIFSEKKFKIIGDVELYNTDTYGGYKAFERIE